MFDGEEETEEGTCVSEKTQSAMINNPQHINVCGLHTQNKSARRNPMEDEKNKTQKMTLK